VVARWPIQIDQPTVAVRLPIQKAPPIGLPELVVPAPVDRPAEATSPAADLTVVAKAPPADLPVAAMEPAADLGQPGATQSPRGARVGELARLAVLLVAIFIGFRSIAQTFRVDGPSMLPNFQTGQTLIINRMAYWHIEGTPLEGLLPVRPQGSVDYVFGGPRRGDAVVFRPPGGSNFESDLIKRIIGLPGDVVAIEDGRVVVNGQRLEEPYVQFPADYTYPGDDLAVLVPSDSYFVLGDNRPVSADSHLGWLVPADKLVGPAWLSYWPLQLWGLVPHGEVREVPLDQPAQKG
jgi:signal peptidase I